MRSIGSKRQFFWNDALLEKEYTTARLQLSDKPVKRERVLEYDQPWEKDSAGYVQIFRDEDKYRMYYVCSVRENIHDYDAHEWNYAKRRICYAESADGFHFTKPNLGLRSFQGSFDNNIVLDYTDFNELDNFFVYKDENPDCLPEERYKAIAYNCEGEITQRKNGVPSNRVLVAWLSADGIHFNRLGVLPIEGRFDTHNTLYWSAEDQKYHIYLRDIHISPVDQSWVRDVRHTTSADFRTWSEAEPIRFQNSTEDLQMYTNGVLPYYRGSHMWIGLPTRYMEYQEWCPNFAHLPAREQRLSLMEKTEPRAGLALTDCAFMCSENKTDWYRFDEAFLTPGPENGNNWFYGDCYPAIGMLETENEFLEKELSFYMPAKTWKPEGFLIKRTYLCRYSMRIDGFACVHADAGKAQVLTVPFTFTGDSMEMNFRTSAFGYVSVSLTDEEGKELEGFTDVLLFGDSISRPVIFEGNLASLNGKQVRLKLSMRDADIYSFRFFQQ